MELLGLPQALGPGWLECTMAHQIVPKSAAENDSSYSKIQRVVDYAVVSSQMLAVCVGSRGPTEHKRVAHASWLHLSGD